MEFRLWLEVDKTWSGVRSEIIKFWRSLEERPIIPTPIPSYHHGSSYNQDTVRITGTAEFINSVLSRIKDFLRHDTPTVELDIDYHQCMDKYKRPIPLKYACYIRLREKKKKLDFKG